MFSGGNNKNYAKNYSYDKVDYSEDYLVEDYPYVEPEELVKYCKKDSENIKVNYMFLKFLDNQRAIPDG
jgi:hypothetical protein